MTPFLLYHTFCLKNVGERVYFFEKGYVTCTTRKGDEYH
ncbi:hypothetical protein B4071_3769 [Bacillus subtilis]|nr:hypothetical protein B4071_3769 [Bacillus subtilis]